MAAADRDVLRGLAERVARNAARPSESVKRESWYAHNDLNSTKPLVLVDPENGWNEIVTPESIVCSGELARRWEMVLRKELFWGDALKDDKPLEPFSRLGIPTRTANGEYRRTTTEESRDSPTPGRERSRDPRTWQKSARLKSRSTMRPPTKRSPSAQDVFGDILRVGLRGIWWWSLGMTLDLARLVGLEKMLYLMYDDPGMVHKIMGLLRDGYLAKLGSLEQNNLLYLNNAHSYVGSGGIGYTRELPRGHGEAGGKPWSGPPTCGA